MRTIDVEEAKYIVKKEGVVSSRPCKTVRAGGAEPLSSHELGDGSVLELVRLYGNSWLHRKYIHLLYTAKEL